MHIQEVLQGQTFVLTALLEVCINFLHTMYVNMNDLLKYSIESFKLFKFI